MEKEEIEKLLQGVSKENGEATKAAIEAATKGLITTDQLASKLEACGITDKSIKDLTTAVEKQGIELAKIISGKTEKFESVKDLVHKQITDNAQAIKALAESNNGTVKFKVDKTLVQRSSVSDNRMGYREAGIGVLPHKGLVFENLWPTVTLSEADLKESNGVIYYMDQLAKTRNAAPVAEGTTKPEAAITFIDKIAKLEVIANHIPVTKQAYRHLGFMAGEVDTLLRENLALTRDTQLYRGNGTSPNLKGVVTSASALVLANLPSYQKLIEANLYDLIANLVVYISNNKKSKYRANVVTMNPADVLKYKLAKAVDGHYILPPFVSADAMRIDNVQVVESSEVDVNTLVIGDFTKGRIYRSESVNITMGLISNQFIENKWTILAEEEMMLLIRDVDADAYVKVTDIDAAINALNIP
jgi:hypothetical protein